MANRYRFTLPDGQMFESTSTPAQIHKTYPGARITHRVEVDDLGQGYLTPYHGQAEVAAPVPAADEPPADEAVAEKPASRGKKGA